MRKQKHELMAYKGKQQIAMITAYDAWSAGLVDRYVDIILVGDSLGMVVQGNDSTLPVTLDEIIYHGKLVSRANQSAFLVVDMPFMTYHISIEQTMLNAARIMKETCAQAVKLEGGKSICPEVKALTQAGIPVFGHLGLTPQSLHQLGGWQKQAKTQEQQTTLMEDAKALVNAGICFLILENIPHDFAKQVTQELPIPTIGIGAGADTDGQVQVFHDLFHLNPDFLPRHATVQAHLGEAMQEALQSYQEKVKAKEILSK